MSNFKKILEIEKKNDYLINSTIKKINLKKEKFIEELNLKEDAIKQDYKKELANDFEREIKLLEKEKELIIQEAKEKAKFIRDNSGVELALNFLKEEIKNV